MLIPRTGTPASHGHGKTGVITWKNKEFLNVIKIADFLFILFLFVFIYAQF